jgi:predicted helicase
MEPHEALNDNKVYKVVWDVLQALRSHDDRFDAFVNKLDLIGKDTRKMEVIAITDKIAKKKREDGAPQPARKPKAATPSASPSRRRRWHGAGRTQVQVGELERALNAKLVKKCGNRTHWEDWANDIAKIAQTHISRITAIRRRPQSNKKEVAAFTPLPTSCATT